MDKQIGIIGTAGLGKHIAQINERFQEGVLVIDRPQPEPIEITNVAELPIASIGNDYFHNRFESKHKNSAPYNFFKSKKRKMQQRKSRRANRK